MDEPAYLLKRLLLRYIEPNRVVAFYHNFYQTLPVFLILFFLFFTSEGYGQSILKGYIRDADGQGLAFVSTGLLTATEAKLVKGTLTNEAGAYEFIGVQNGNYMVVANMVGYTSGTSSLIKVEQPLINVPGITLTQVTKNLSEVLVTSKRPFVEQQTDRMVVNVANSIIGSGSTALEILEKAPGVIVDHQNEQLQLRGKEGVMVQIDGKQTYLSMPEVVALLRSMPADNIDRIELITNPSARYDAAGNAGIIDIRLKKNNDVGTNGFFSIGAGSGRYDRERGSLQLNHRKTKVNLFGTYSINREGNYDKWDLLRKQADGTERNIIKQDAYTQKRNFSHNVKAGADYFINKNTTIGLVWTGIWNNYLEENTTGSAFRRQESGGIYLQTLSKKTLSDYSSNHTGNLNLQHNFSNQGGQLTADFDLGHFERVYHNALTTETLLSRDLVLPPSGLETPMLTNININSFRASYSQPITKSWKMEVGLKSSSVRSDNDVAFYAGEASKLKPDLELFNYFQYTERINAAYANFSGKISKKNDVQLGLRTEQTHSVGNSINRQKTVKRDYVNLFPSLFLSQMLSDNHSLTLSYSYRIDRPNYRNLNPGRYYLDQYIYYRGNPDLRPQYTQSLELKHGFKNKIFTSFGASYIHDQIFYVIQPVNGNITEGLHDNIGKSQAYNLIISSPVLVRPGWTMQTSLLGIYNYLQYTFLNTPMQVIQLSGRFNASNAITLGHNWTAEVMGWLSTPTVNGLWRSPWLGSLDAGLQKTLNSKWKVKLSLQDLLHTNQLRGIIQTPDYYYNFQLVRDTRIAMLNLTYAFGNQQLKGIRQRKTGSEEEIQRTN